MDLKADDYLYPLLQYSNVPIVGISILSPFILTSWSTTSVWLFQTNNEQRIAGVSQEWTVGKGGEIMMMF